MTFGFMIVALLAGCFGTNDTFYKIAVMGILVGVCETASYVRRIYKKAVPFD